VKSNVWKLKCAFSDFNLLVTLFHKSDGIQQITKHEMLTMVFLRYPKPKYISRIKYQ